jgi:cytoskeletal protein RodZ
MVDLSADGSLQQVREDDPSELPTQMADFSVADSTEPDFVPAPWYKSRVALGLWATALILLLALIVYGIVEISRGAGSSTPTTTSSTTSTRSSTSSSTTTPSTTATETSPPTETSEQTPEEAPPPQQGNNSPAPAPPTHHHHHLPHIPMPHWF